MGHNCFWISALFTTQEHKKVSASCCTTFKRGPPVKSQIKLTHFNVVNLGRMWTLFFWLWFSFHCLLWECLSKNTVATMQHWCTGGCGLWLVQTKLWWWHHGALDSKTRGCCFNLCSLNFYFLVINSVTCQLQHSHCPHQCACFGEFLFSISQTLHLSAIPLLSHFLSLKKNQKLKICFQKFKITG